MSYHDLSDSGMSEQERVSEAQRIIGIVDISSMSRVNDKEREFIGKMRGSRFCSIKQLFYLRDIKDKYL